MNNKLSNKKFLALAILSVTAVTALAGCKKGNGGNYDPTTTIYLEPFSGSGFGYEWIIDLVNEWQAESNSNFKIKVDESSVSMAKGQLETIASGTSKTDIFFGARPEYKAGIYKDYFEDMTDFLDMKPDGDDGMTVKEKITDWETWERVGAKNTYNPETGEFGYEGCYMLPYTITISGLIFDYDFFDDNNLLYYAKNDTETIAELEEQGIHYNKAGNFLTFVSSDHATNYEEGDKIATAGKDGKYGTYDDGQPTTLAEFNTLRDKIKAKGTNWTAFMCSKQGGYLDSVIVPTFAQMSGLDAYYTLCNFNFGKEAVELELYDGTKQSVGFENGYLAYKAKGIEEAIDFTYQNFFKSKDYYARPNDVSASQDNFINGLNGGSKQYAFINEGNWFEEEAKSTFSDAHDKGGKAWGDYDLRFLCLPEFEGQKGIDGLGNGTCFSSPEYGAITVRKQTDPAKLEAIKSFLSFCLRNESLAKSNAKCGVMLGYKYDIPEEIKSTMTKFQKTTQEIYADRENIKVLPFSTDKLCCPVTYASSSVLSVDEILPVGQGGATSSILMLDTSNTPSSLVTIIRENYSLNAWNGLLEEIKEALS